MRKIGNLIYFAFFFFCLLTPAAVLKAEDNFNPNNIISDGEILNSNTMDLNSIQALLKSKNSYLANYSCANPDGKNMTAAEIIYDRAITNKVSPKFIIVLLQKEMGLIEDDSPKQSQLDWATGYGCPDGSACNTRWQGFWKQVNSATLQFRDYMDNPQLYTYKVGQTYTFTNPYSTTITATVNVTPANQATAALYNYTPHVYNGNYNFYRIWQRYFTRTYYDGSLLRADGEAGVWLIQNGLKRPFLSRSALTSRFDESKIIVVNKSDLDKYEKGAPIRFPNYSLIRSPQGSIYLLVDNERRMFSSSAIFKKIGYNPSEIIDVSSDDINSYAEGQPITATSTYPAGALLQDKKTGGVYWVYEGAKAPLWDSIFLKTKFKGKAIIKTTAIELDTYTTTNPVLFGDGELLKSNNSSAVYLIVNGQKRPFYSGTAFEKLGYKWSNVITVSPKVLYLYALGDPITGDPEKN